MTQSLYQVFCSTKKLYTYHEFTTTIGGSWGSFESNGFFAMDLQWSVGSLVGSAIEGEQLWTLISKYIKGAHDFSGSQSEANQHFQCSKMTGHRWHRGRLSMLYHPREPPAIVRWWYRHFTAELDASPLTPGLVGREDFQTSRDHHGNHPINPPALPTHPPRKS